MRVLMFGWEFPPHITGGLGTACYGLVKGLAKNNVEVLFVVPKAYGDEDASAVKIVNASDIEVNLQSISIEEFWKKVSFLNIASNLIPYVSPEEFKEIESKNTLDKVDIRQTIFKTKYEFTGKYGHDLLEEVSRYALIAQEIACTNNFDVIHAHDWLTYPAGIAAKVASGKPLIIHVHATEFDRSGENINQSVFDIERQGMLAADKIITVSNYTQNIVVNRYGIDSSKVFTVHNAVDFDLENYEHKRWEKSVPEKVVTFLGRVTFQKGPEYFVEAANIVLQRYKNVRFVMAGSGDMLNRMVDRVAKLGISDKFHFTGFLKGDDVDKMFMKSDVYVMPSVSEPFGISPLEAMRASVPVIISKQSGVSEVLKHAVKVDFWDIDAMADAIYGLLCYDGLSTMFRDLGKQEVLALKWEDAAKKINNIYHSVNN